MLLKMIKENKTITSQKEVFRVGFDIRPYYDRRDLVRQVLQHHQTMKLKNSLKTLKESFSLNRYRILVQVHVFKSNKDINTGPLGSMKKVVEKRTTPLI